LGTKTGFFSKKRKPA